ncbi:acidic repeat-containing protein isoform X1 [Canis lupus familiaris]|uniref:Germ cell nuclear acidic peptidase n=1 Tax=Canis lupus familiaris TaxID=9615 RepID=A0A8I3P830_CANLF|nr:acidic repeat-containing protein isoform X1 [Canis lupus familiaris]XP_038443624.1 acidic repeat-containing protein isoform X1 [Canis lupus familiaris]
MDMSEEAGQSKIQDDDCCIITVDSSSDGEFEPYATKRKEQKGNVSYVVIDSDSEDEYFSDKVRSHISDVSSEDEILDVLSDNEEQQRPAQEAPILITDDDSSDFEGPVLIIDEDSCDQGQAASNGNAMDISDVFQHNSSHGVGEPNLGENLCQPPNVAEATVEIPDEEPTPVVEQPRKRKSKTKNICVTPAVRASKRRAPSQKKPGAGKIEKSKPGRAMCKIPGCFLRDLENAKQYSGRNFKQNKDSLVQKIYALFNSSVFDKKLPEKIDIGWNKKMLRTAGLCTTGETRYPKKERYAKIEISLKVCDSADRLRDTLIHEICHAASWLLDGVRDSHGDAWKYYAKKSNMVHPELPMVTRCHNYKINYRIHYECTRCKTRVGRYTRSLNTDRFICAKCQGPLVMLPLTRKDGTPIAPHVRPFAKYVQENYRTIKHETEGISHGDVMRRLSKDYAIRQGRHRDQDQDQDPDQDQDRDQDQDQDQDQDRDQDRDQDQDH